MSPEAQRIAVASACGISLDRWRFTAFHNNQPGIDFSGYFTEEEAIKSASKAPKSLPLSVIVKYTLEVSALPDYLNDLNAMHEAEKTLNVDETDDYMEHLDSNLGDPQDDKPAPAFFSYTATAAQLAEAFLRAIRKWKE